MVFILEEHCKSANIGEGRNYGAEGAGVYGNGICGNSKHLRGTWQPEKVGRVRLVGL